MNIYEAIDRCYVSKNDLTPDIRYELKKMYDQATWIRAVKLFLRSIGNQHQVSGSVIKTLYDLCNLADEGQELTHKQLLYISNNLIDNWDQMSMEVRNLLYI